MIEKVNNLSKTFFNKLCLEIDKIDIKQEQENIFYVKIETPDSSLLIGPHGKNLEDIKKLLSQILSKALEKKIMLHIEVNDYLKSKEDRLFSFIKSKIEYLNQKGGELKLPYFTSYERKKIHSFISDNYNGKITTSSKGEGEERRIYLIKDTLKLSIDIDGDNI